MKFTKADYDRALADLSLAATQLAPDGRNCAVCGDTDHQAFECHQNPLVLARRYEELKEKADELHDSLHRVMGELGR
ncbi:MAG: hypothetical protein HOW73_20165 [Polyangiaceae bacterium]|nr:hypothetical protein [Polyangiaceae bacterium]